MSSTHRVNGAQAAPGAKSKTITVAIPEELLWQVDELSKRDYMSRSDTIRQALLEYARKPWNETSIEHFKRLKNTKRDQDD